MTGGRLSAAAVKPPAAKNHRTRAAPDVETREREADRIADDALNLRELGRAPAPPLLPPTGSPSAFAEGFGAGQPLDTATRAYFEPRFGMDFSGVRVHSGPAAARDADKRGAQAYTNGSDLVFGPGMYAPGRESGRQLIAHELAHVAQHRSGLLEPGRIYLKPKSLRFLDEPTLEEISDGKKVLKEGASGEAVVRVTVAIAELGFYPISVVDEKFEPPLTSGVMKFQAAKGLGAKAISGAVDKPTFDALDAEFSASYKVERGLIAGQKAASLEAGTDPLTAEERKATDRAISTEVKAGPGMALPTFKPKIPGQDEYEKRLTKLVERIILEEYAMYGKDKAADHADAGKLYGWSQIEVVAKAAQAEVDAVFSKYYGGKSFPTLAKGVNILDAWDDKVASLSAGGKPAKDDAADWRVRKILLQDDSVRALNKQHGAVISRAAEAAIIVRVKDALVAKHYAKLLETHKGWPGYADPDTGRIFIQRFQSTGANARRLDMWGYFQTFIHEYIHTIEVGAHRTHRQGMTGEKGGDVLREGVTDYLTKIVWSGVKIDDALRAKIEGPYHDAANKITIPPLNTYSESENAERLAGVVGIRNLLAAFFLGKLDLIGKP